MIDTHLASSSRRGMPSFKFLSACILVLSLILSNVATLLSSSFHDALYRALSAQLLAMAPDSAPKILSKSISAKNTSLSGTQKKLVSRNRILQSEKRLFAGRVSDLSLRISSMSAKNKALQLAANNLGKSTELQKTAVKDFKKKSIDRMVRSKLVNLASLPERALPIVGAGVLVGVAAYEINSDCEMLRDITKLAAVNGLREKDRGEDEVCGLTIPTVIKWDEVKLYVDRKMDAFEISSIARKFKLSREDARTTLERTYIPSVLIERILDSLGY